MESSMVDALLALAGPLIGAGAGSYFGLKGALNGLRERSQRIEEGVKRVEQLVTAHRLDTSRYVAEIRRDVQSQE